MNNIENFRLLNKINTCATRITEDYFEKSHLIPVDSELHKIAVRYSFENVAFGLATEDIYRDLKEGNDGDLEETLQYAADYLQDIIKIGKSWPLNETTCHTYSIIYSACNNAAFALELLNKLATNLNIKLEE